MEIPKTGLASRIRELIQKRKQPFTPRHLYEALGIPKGPCRDYVRLAIQDFRARGEIEEAGFGKYRYNRAYQQKRATGKMQLKKKILKAVYVSHAEFLASDLQKLSGAPNLNYVQKIIRKLRAAGYLRKVARRPCLHGIGFECLYGVCDRDRFRIDIME